MTEAPDVRLQLEKTMSELLGRIRNQLSLPGPDRAETILVLARAYAELAKQ